MHPTVLILAIPLGLIMLIWGATRFVASASCIAVIWRVPPLLIGVIIIGFGTSTPELLVSVLAAREGLGDMAMGNVLGSNIVNIGFVLGLTALIAPIAVHSNIIRQEIPFLFICGAIIGWLLYDQNISRVDAVILLIIFGGFVAYSILKSLKIDEDALASDVEHDMVGKSMNGRKAAVFLVLGLMALMVGSRLLVAGSTALAEQLGVNDLIIGLTIVALGTSLPELTTSLIAALRKEPDLAIGNIVGSNIFNILAVTGSAALLSPMQNIPTEMFVRDWAVMMAFTVILVVVSVGLKKSGSISRFDGGLLLVGALAYNVYLIGSQI